MPDDKTWSMKDLEMVWAEGNSPESSKPDAPVSQLAKAARKPAHHNSKVKAALLLLGGTCFAILGTLLFSLTSGKSPEKITATAPETTQPVATSNDGWETAAKQSASDAGTAINIPGTQKPDTEATPTPSTAAPANNSAIQPSSSSAKTTPTPTTSVVAPVPAVVKANPVAKMPTQAIAAAPTVVTKPIVTQPVAPKAIPQAPVKPAPTVVAKTESKAVMAQPPVVKAIPQAPVAKSEPKAITTPAAATIAPPKAITKPEPKPVAPPVAVASNPAPAATPISWEQASAAGVYGGEATADSAIAQPVGGLGVAAGAKDGGKDGKQQQAQRQQSNYEGAMSPTLLLAAGTSVRGHTVAPYTVGISKEQSVAVPLSISLDEPIELDKGYRLPVGTIVNFVASVRDNGSVVATSRNADIGGIEIQLREGVFSLTSDNNGLLMAKEVSTGDGDLARADLNSVVWGAAAGAGRAILQSGSTTQTNNGLLGTTTTQTNSGSPNILGGVLQGGFDPLATNGQRRAQQTADRIENRSKLNTIDVNTKVKLFVNASVQVQIPISGQQVVQAEDQEELPPPRLITSNSVPSATENELPPPPQVSVAPQSATQTPVVQPPAPAQPVAAPPQTPVIVPKQSITTTPSLNPPKTSPTW